MSEVNRADRVRRTARDDALAQRLIDEGAAMLAETGIDGLSLRALAARAGTSTMSVYSRFGDRAGLLAAMHREGFRRLGAALSAADDADPLERLATLGAAYRRAALASPHLYALMFGPGFTPDVEGERAAAATYTPLVEAVTAAVTAGVVTGDPERVARHLWIVVHGGVSLELGGHLDVDDATHDQTLVAAITPFLA